MPRHRSIYTDTTKYQVVYKPEISTDLHCLLCLKCPCHPLSCLCFPNVSTKATESSYIHVYPNRLEYNYPLATVAWDCTCHIVDNVKTIYFDRAQMDEVYALDGCICGYDKTVVVKGSCLSCSDVEAEQCCGRVFLPCVEDAPALVTIIQERKTRRLAELKVDAVTTMDRDTPLERVAPKRTSIDNGSTFTSRETPTSKNNMDTVRDPSTTIDLVKSQPRSQPKNQKRTSVVDTVSIDQTIPGDLDVKDSKDSKEIKETKDQKDKDKTTITIDQDNNVIIHFDNDKKKEKEKEKDTNEV